MKKIDYTADFEVFWKTYPRTPIMSKLKAFQCWKKMDDEDRSMALVGLLAYNAWLKSKPDHPACHATTFLNQRRFEGFAEAFNQAQATPVAQAPQKPTHGAPWGSGIWLQEGTMEWKAWSRYYQTILRQVTPPMDRYGGWIFSSLWPPTVAQPIQDLSDEYGDYGSPRLVG